GRREGRGGQRGGGGPRRAGDRPRRGRGGRPPRPEGGLISPRAPVIRPRALGPKAPAEPRPVHGRQGTAMTNRFPQFIIGGAPRSGTTFLCRALGRHPQASMAQPTVPEPEVFFGPQ